MPAVTQRRGDLLNYQITESDPPLISAADPCCVVATQEVAAQRNPSAPAFRRGVRSFPSKKQPAPPAAAMAPAEPEEDNPYALFMAGGEADEAMDVVSSIHGCRCSTTLTV